MCRGLLELLFDPFETLVFLCFRASSAFATLTRAFKAPLLGRAGPARPGPAISRDGPGRLQAPCRLGLQSTEFQGSTTIFSQTAFFCAATGRS